MNSFIKDLIPPLLINSIKKLRRYHRTYSSFDEALKHCKNPSGYQDPHFVRYLVEQTKQFISGINQETDYILEDQTTIHTFLALPFISCHESINIVDIGGGCGLHYFQFKKVVRDRIRFNWAVVETPALCQASKSIENDELHFYENLDDAMKNSGRTDLVISSGAIQYFSDPRSILAQIINLKAKYVMLTRLSLALIDFDIITVQRSRYSQNGLEKLPAGFEDIIIEYPHTNMCEKDFVNIITKGYKIVVFLKDQSGAQHINNYPIKGYGVLLERIE
jgi:putative methyltransferase (TIGR04325 family)